MNEEKFTGKADVYDRYRPAYPAEIAQWLYEKTRAETVADVGAGTGRFTTCLCAKPWKITAVEPNADMREKLRENCPDVEIVDASAERTGIAAGSIDLVTAAQAFHWFDRERFKAECRRILTPKGRLALVWNNHRENDFRRDRDKVFITYCGICDSAGGGEKDGDLFLRNEYFSAIEYFSATHRVSMDEEQFVGYSLSHSYSPKKGDEHYDAFVDELRGIVRKHQRNGRVEVSYEATCYLGTL
ncbi:MAG: methyltransferase domain-containing protein [Treponemataceae bacterium]|nr:methyltransferase domain-containing protein [Treponemataceae bacterium]